MEKDRNSTPRGVVTTRSTTPASKDKNKRKVRANALLKTETLQFIPDAYLALMPALPASKASSVAVARWCCEMHEKLRDQNKSANNIVLFSSWIRLFQDGKVDHTDTTPLQKLRHKKKKILYLYSDTLLALQLFRSEDPTSRQKGLQQLMVCAHYGFHSHHGDIPFVVTQQATCFLCAALDLTPEQLLQTIESAKLPHFSDIMAIRRSIHADEREQFYCVLSYLGILPEAQTVEDLAQHAKNNWKNSDDLFLAHAQASTMLPAWQSKSRKLRFEFELDAVELANVVKRQKAAVDTTAADLNVLNSIYRKVKFTGDHDEPSAEDAAAFLSTIRTYLQFAAERAIDASADSLFDWVKSQGFTSPKQLALIKVLAADAGLGVADQKTIADLRAAVEKYRSDQRSIVQKASAKALEGPLVARWFVGFARGAIAQLAGRAIVTGAITMALGPAISTAGLDGHIAIVAAICTADCVLKIAAGAWQLRSRLVAPADNRRRISLALTTVTVVAAMTQPFIAAASGAWHIDQIERNDVNRGLMATVDSFGGPDVYMTVQLVANTTARLARQSLQSLTTSNFSAGIAVTYLNREALDEDDLESLNAVRDLLYVTSTLASVGTVFWLGAIVPPTWVAIAASAVNEGIDEWAADAAMLLTMKYRQWNADYEGSDARFAISNLPTPSPFEDVPNTYLAHFLTHSATRITHFGLPDLCSMMGDFALIAGNREAYLAMKSIGFLLNGLFGGRRGAMTAYLRAPKGKLPSGFVTWCLRTIFGVRDTTRRVQIRPVVFAEVSSLEYDAAKARFGKPKIQWNWEACKSIAVDGQVLAVRFPVDTIDTFHQASRTAVEVAAFNMLCMHCHPGEYLLLQPVHKPSQPSPDELSVLDQLCRLASARKDAQGIETQVSAQSTRLFQRDFQARTVLFGNGFLAEAIEAEVMEAERACAPADLAGQDAKAIEAKAAAVLADLRSQDAICASFVDGSRHAIFIRCYEGFAHIYSPLTDQPLDMVDMAGIDILKTLSRHLRKLKLKPDSEVTIAWAAEREPTGDEPSSVVIDIDAPRPVQTDGQPPASGSGSGSGSGSSSSSATGFNASKPRVPKALPAMVPAGVAAPGPLADRKSKKIYREACKPPQYALPVVNMLCMYIGGNDPACRLAETDLPKPEKKGKRGARSVGFGELAGIARTKKGMPAVLAVASVERDKTGKWVWAPWPPNLHSLRAVGVSLRRAQSAAASAGLLAEDKSDASVIHYVDPSIEPIMTPGNSLIAAVRRLLELAPNRRRCEVIFPVVNGPTAPLCTRILELFENAMAQAWPAAGVRSAVRTIMEEIPEDDFDDACAAVFWAFEATGNQQVPREVRQGLFLDTVVLMHDRRLLDKRNGLAFLDDHATTAVKRWDAFRASAIDPSDSDKGSPDDASSSS